MTKQKISFNFYINKKNKSSLIKKRVKWYYNVLDVISAIRNGDSHEKTRNYWKFLKNKLSKNKDQPVSITNQFKFEAAGGKLCLTDVLDYDNIIKLAESFSTNGGVSFIKWLSGKSDTIDEKSKLKAYDLWDKNILDKVEIGTTKDTYSKFISTFLMTYMILLGYWEKEIYMKGIDYSYYYEQADDI